MDSMRAPGGSLIWILLTANAFGGSFNIEATSGGDLGLVNYSEAGHYAPAPPVAPSPPNPKLATLASFRADEPVEVDLSESALASQLISSLSGARLDTQMGSTRAQPENLLSESALATIVKNVRRQVYSENRLAYMQRAVQGRELRCEQLAALLGLLTFSDDRLALVQKVGAQVTDAENYPVLYRFFPFESDRASLAASF